ncbi:MAG: DUF6064 family protein [Omnitrophica WOR_2 bacterium]
MKTPFSNEQFLAVFEQYNVSVFPAQIIILLLGFLALKLVFRSGVRKSIYVSSFLAILWLWSGIVYHIGFFSDLNKPAIVFGLLFIIQGVLIIYEGWFKKALAFSFTQIISNDIGLFFVLFGLIIYPFISWFTEKSLVHIISAGLPCPSVIITLGFFMLNSARIKWYLFIIPVLWSIIGISAALNFGIYQDFMMIIGALALVLINRKQKIKTTAVGI